jgi:hypothetical protein
MLGRHSDERVGDLVGDGQPGIIFRHRENGCNGAVKRKLDQHPRCRRNGFNDRVEEALRPPMQQHAEHDEEEIVCVEARNRDHRVLGREFMN